MYIEQTWERFCSVMERKIGKQEADIWIRGTMRPEVIDPQRVRVRVENKHYQDWIRDNLMGHIEGAWTDTLGVRPVVEVLIEGAGEPAEAPAAPTAARRAATHLDAKMTFETFVVGKCNEFAHAASIAVADGPGRTHNPLFIYGGTGLGKTHLVHAIGNRVSARMGGGGVYYCTAEQFLSNMVRAIQNRAIAEFRERFRTQVDVLLLDDVQFLAGRDRTEEELFHIFESMRQEGKQIVMTSDEPPRNIGKLEPRLRTRFEGGLLADVQPPDVETMMAILGTKAQALRLDIPGDVAHTIASRVRNSVRELEGVLNRLTALRSFYGAPITMSFIQERMSDIVPPPAPPPTADVIIAKVAEHYGVRPADIRGNRRPANIAWPRQVAMYLTRKITNLSFPEIGRAFHRDNSTVQHGVKKIEEEARSNPNTRAELDHLEKMCRGG